MGRTQHYNLAEEQLAKAAGYRVINPLHWLAVLTASTHASLANVADEIDARRTLQAEIEKLRIEVATAPGVDTRTWLMDMDMAGQGG